MLDCACASSIRSRGSRRVALCGLVLAAGGCGRAMSSGQKVEKELKSIGQPKQEVFPFAGKVLADGQPPQVPRDQKIVVVLFDRAKPNLSVGDRPRAVCNSQGEFSFTTYDNSDGVDAGEYEVAIAQLAFNRKDDSFTGPDALHNLYNDPDKNKSKSEFVIKHAAPGKRDYRFDLRLAGEEPVQSPGQHAVTQIAAQ